MALIGRRGARRRITAVRLQSKLGLVAAAVAFALGAGGAADATSLLGQTVTVDLTDTAVGDFGPQTVTVVSGLDGNYFNDQEFDVNAGANGDVFSVSSTSNF